MAKHLSSALPERKDGSWWLRLAGRPGSPDPERHQASALVQGCLLREPLPSMVARAQRDVISGGERETQ